MAPGYSASCPCCGYEHDFATKRDMEQAWARWWVAVRRLARSSGWTRQKGATL